MTTLFLDFETYWDQEYSLKKMTRIEYIRDPRFDILGFGCAWNDNPPQWFGLDYSADLTGKPEDAINGAIKYIRDHQNELTIVSHNALFDAMILHEKFGIQPKRWADTLAMSRALLALPKNDLESVASLFGFGNKVKGYLTPGATEADEKLIAGCLADVEMCRKIYNKLLPFMPDSEMELIHLTTRMGIEGHLELDKDLLEVSLKELIEEREQTIKASGYEESQFTSNQKFGQILNSLNIHIPIKISATTEKETEAFGKNDPEFQELMADYPEHKTLWDARLAAKSNIEIKRTEKLLNIARLNPKMPMPLNYYGAHCVTGDVEVLTPTGWTPLKNWNGGEIAQVNNQQQIEFLPAEKFVGPIEKEWISINAPYIKSTFTKGHTIPYLKHGSFKWSTIKAGNINLKKSIFAPLSGQLNTVGNITAEQMRVLVMIQADGHFETKTNNGRGLFIFLKKPRKIERARQLLTDANVPYTEHSYPSHPGYIRFRIKYIDYPNWITEERKYFGSWLLDSTPEARLAFTEELMHWDGWAQGGQQCYSTTIKENANWVVTICHLTNKCASYSPKLRKDRINPVYNVRIRQRNYGLIKNTELTNIIDPQTTYCTITQTGFWLARHKGNIFITGNTGRFSGADGLNVQNLPKHGHIRKSFRAPKGWKVINPDSSQIELRINLWFSGQTDMYEAAISANKARDIYRIEAGRQFNVEPEQVSSDQRAFGKAIQLGLGYGMGWPKFRRQCAGGPLGMAPIHLTPEEAQRTVSGYRERHQAVIQSWYYNQDRLGDMLTKGSRVERGPITYTHNMIQLPNGMAIQYPGLRYTDHEEWVYGRHEDEKKCKRIYGGKIQENIIQALARIAITDQMLEIAKELIIVSQTHDEIICLVRENEAEAALEFAINIMSQTPPWAPGLILSAEGKIMDYYGK